MYIIIRRLSSNYRFLKNQEVILRMNFKIKTDIFKRIVEKDPTILEGTHHYVFLD